MKRLIGHVLMNVLKIRSFAAVMFRRLFQTEFENFWPKFSLDQQMALKKELIARITQVDDHESVRKKICYIAAELARNLMGKFTSSLHLHTRIL